MNIVGTRSLRVYFGFVFLLFAAFPMLAGAGVFGAGLCANDPSLYRCITVARGDTWESLFPDEGQREFVGRVNRSNVRLRAGETIAVPQDLERATTMSLSPFPVVDAAYAVKTLVFSQALLAWAAYNDEGRLMNWGPASGGKSWCPDTGHSCRTPAGTYAVLYKGGARCKSHTFPIGKGGAPMPYCVFFRRGYAFHGSSEVPGANASHGCVRVFTQDARWINESFVELPNALEETAGTSVVILPDAAR